VLIEKVASNDTDFKKLSHISDQSPELYTLLSRPEIANDLDELPSGPHILYGPNLYQAWRLYPDERGAFVTGVAPENLTSSQG
jgi:hypothetical protein